MQVVFFCKGLPRCNARKRDLPFEIDFETFRTVAESNCHYCGSPPTKISRRGGTATPWAYNGIDRKDNKRGYSPDNILPSCTVCNIAKRARPYSDFIEWIKKAYDTTKDYPH
jgi:hypothetical protein